MAPLLVLWVLSEGSSYGYEIKKALTDRGMAFWFGLADTSIYSALRTLAKHGHVREVGTEQPGARPPRTRYEITPEGRRHYRDLMLEAIATVRLPVQPFDVFLAAGGDLDVGTVVDALAGRRDVLEGLSAAIETHRRAAPAPAIADRNLAIVQAELAWLSTLEPASVT